MPIPLTQNRLICFKGRLFRSFFSGHVLEGLGFPELAGFGGHGESGFEIFLGDEIAEVLERDSEKFFPIANLVDSELFKSAVELSFQAGGGGSFRS